MAAATADIAAAPISFSEPSMIQLGAGGGDSGGGGNGELTCRRRLLLLLYALIYGFLGKKDWTECFRKREGEGASELERISLS